MTPIRIGTIGLEIGADYAARRCAAYAHLHGAVFVAMDDRAACWAMSPGSREAIAVSALEEDSVLGTFTHSRRSVAPVIAECIRFRLGEISA